MPISDRVAWDNQVKINSDPYGKACVDVARRVMEILDAEAGPITDVHALVCRADTDADGGGLTGFMAGCVAEMVSRLHSRGEEFRKLWNADYGVTAEKKGVVNPAILTIGGSAPEN